ncbi:acyl carrier protein [bacterium]|nr:acyl carrier protein [bacterium]
MNMEAKQEKAISQLFEAKLLQIVRRYNEDAHAFDMSASVFDHALGMDSLDLAEVFSWIEHQFGDSPLDDQGPQFETWNDLVQWVVSCQKDRSAVY